MAGALSGPHLSANLLDNTEYPFTADDLEIVVEIMKQDTGIVLSEAKANLVYSRLAKRIRKLGLVDFAAYCALVTSSEGNPERQHMITALTTNVTGFFREAHHFEHMRTKILPDLVKRAKAGQRIRLWSAACSSGPEAYSMALTLLQVLPDAERYDIRILATDIDTNVLAIASAGIYEESLLTPVPADLRKQWFKPVVGNPEHFQIGAEVRRLITFKPLNLIGNWPMKGLFQVIFCRNVVIYFDHATQVQLWARFVPLLDEHGVLYIGHSERLLGGAANQMYSDGVTAYRKFDKAGEK